MATKLLTDGITSSYPCTNPDLDPKDQFYVHLSGYGSSEYVIDDTDLEIFSSTTSQGLVGGAFVRSSRLV